MKPFLSYIKYQAKLIIWDLFRIFSGVNAPPAPLPIDFSKILNVLVIRPDRLGDVVLSTPVYESLKRSFPHLKITVMVNPIQAGILEDSGEPFGNRVKRSLISLLRSTKNSVPRQPFSPFAQTP
jgi:hypothetical protein